MTVTFLVPVKKLLEYAWLLRRHQLFTVGDK